MFFKAVCAVFALLSLRHGYRFTSPKMAYLHNARIVWFLPHGTTVTLAETKPVIYSHSVKFTLKNVDMGQGVRQDLQGTFSFWSKMGLVDSGTVQGSDASSMQAGPRRGLSLGTASALFYAGKGDFLLVNGMSVDTKTVELLNKLYKGIKVVE
jgi:hypothetical protein